MPLKLSIVTVCYNAEKTISDTITSVAKQTYPNVEHIVVDGASTDLTLSIIKENQSRLSKWISEPDLGIYDAMNKGIRLASGDLIGILNADDIYYDDTVLARVAGLVEQEELDAVFGDVEFFSPKRPDVTTRRYSSRFFSPKSLAWGWMPAHPTLFLRRELFERYGLYRPDFRIAGDYELIARFFKHDSIRYHYLPEVMVRMSSGGISTGGWRSTLLLNREVLRACRENGISTNLCMLLSKYPLKTLEFLRK